MNDWADSDNFTNSENLWWYGTDFLPSIQDLAVIYESYIREKINSGEEFSEEEFEFFEGILEACIEEEYYDVALKFCNALLSVDPFSTELLSQKGFILMNLDEFEEAKETLNRALEINPTDVDALFNLSLTLFSSGDIDNSLKAIDKALEIEYDEDVLFNKGIFLKAHQRYDEALKVFNTLTDSPIYGIDAYYEIASIYMSLGKVKESLEYHMKAINLDPTSEWHWCNLGITYLRLGRPYKAIDAFLNSLALNDKYEPSKYYLVIAYINAGKLIEALDFLADIEKLNSNDPNAHTIAGLIQGKFRFYEWALEYFLSAIKYDENSAISYIGAGLCYWYLDKYGKAEKYFWDGLARDPKNISLWMIPIDYFVSLGRISTAFSFFEKALLNNPDDDSLLIEFIDFIWEHRKYEKGVAALENYQTLSKNSPLLSFELGKLYLKTKNFVKALNSFVKGIEIDNAFYERFLKEVPTILPKKAFEKFKKDLDASLANQKMKFNS
ncbi:tetratricopeptide repeat protein [Bacteroidetes/Chlorobi group bacterium MS-B_bin-24]|jgi:tetratricopeptide (TPR) repeat protein|nr:MAG: tetratricopeptide repeat protein [Bacteroidetes/Chlorobi group bacterium MS-B_bin-24]